MNIYKKIITLDDRRTIEIETGKLAKQSDGSVVVKMGNTMLLATVCVAKDGVPDSDFMPLQVEYRERFSALGRFPGGFNKREGRPSDDEVLVSRLVDRALRPLFPSDFHAETFVTIYLISAEEGVYPDVLAGLAASAAIAVSTVPIEAPISEVRVGRINGNFLINPTMKQLENSDLEFMVAATYDNILMVEGECKEISENDMLEALKFAHTEIKKHCLAQIELAKELGIVKREYCHEENDAELSKKVDKISYKRMYEIAKSPSAKQERYDAFEALEATLIAELGFTAEENAKEIKLVKRYFHDVQKKAIRNMILDEGIRLDGRSTTQIRPIWSEIDYLPGAHGSAIFTRGETQALCSVTLGSKLDEKMIDSVLTQGKEKFLLHYNFPPFSTGEARPIRATGRREIGHGNLALRALKMVLPNEDECPYTIRVVSDILESNGSSSMATVCGGTLALMDAGVKIKSPVTGIAMGLISEKGRFAVLSDILGDEDHLGDMDFKVTGTIKGITATQMDIKVDGLPYEVLEKALLQAKEGRLHILNEIQKTISEPRDDYKSYVPRIERLVIPKEFIGAVIGPGGKIIQEMQASTNTTIMIEEVDNTGVILIFSKNADDLNATLKRIKEIVTVPEVGEVYDGIVKSVLDFGAFIEILPGKEALLHISEIDWKRVEKVGDYLKSGDEIKVKLTGIDPKTGKYKLSRKVLLPRPERQEHQVAPPPTEENR